MVSLDKMQAGSEAHKDLFCRSFLNAHRAYEPQDLAWPELSNEHVEMLRALPVWSEALRDESGAGHFLALFADRVEDPLLREAIALQAFEESRHARVIRFMLEHYGVVIPSFVPKEMPADFERGFTGLGYLECADSFAGCGFFEVVRESGFLPDEFLAIFDRFLDEEIQHVVFFVNWLAHHQAARHRDAWPFRAATAAWGYGRAMGRLAGSRQETRPVGYVPAGAEEILAGLTVARFVAACVRENSRRMDVVDPDLLRPRFLPSLAGVALPLLSVFDRSRQGNGDASATKRSGAIAERPHS
ncbi:MAG: ferritin-like domain-containing protein [Deltaproteobacteria bacterium]|nr:ferritin-like domain-containing protein [Deltaproteobacteria bacterium]